MINVLVACECSQTVCIEFRKLGCNAYSCDLVDEYGGHPEWHIKGDCLKILYGNCMFRTCDLRLHYVQRWDLIIAHPPCTFLCKTQLPLYNRARLGDEYVDKREREREKAIDFFMKFTQTGVPTLIENPVGYMNTHYRKPDQNIEPYMFGDAATKKTSLWLFDLPLLRPTKIVEIPPVHKFPSSNSMGDWYYKTSCLPYKERSRVRSKTFPGIAQAIANQYYEFITKR